MTANADTTSSSAGKVAYQDNADTALASSAARKYYALWSNEEVAELVRLQKDLGNR